MFVLPAASVEFATIRTLNSRLPQILARQLAAKRTTTNDTGERRNMRECIDAYEREKVSRDVQNDKKDVQRRAAPSWG